MSLPRWVRALSGLLLGLILWAGEGTPAPPRAHFSPELNFLLDRWTQARRQGRPLALELFQGGDPASGPPGEDRLGVLIRSRSPAALRAAGLRLDSLAGDVASARLTPAQLEALRAVPGVISVEGPGPARLTRLTSPAPPPPGPELDLSLRLTGADRFHQQGITGQGVVVGVVDTGVDWTHRDFRVDRDGDGVEEGSRLLAIWDQTRPGARPAGFSYGSEFTREQIERALVGDDPALDRLTDTSPDRPSHGTHVLGIAAGDGSSSALGLVGLAPAADLVVVRSTLTFEAIVDAVRYVFAQAGPRPAVVNLSLGSHLGAHDGTSNFERALVALSQGPGRAVVVSAGNQGDERVHVGGTLAATGKVRFTLDLPDPPGQKRFALDFWSDPRGPLSVRLIGPDGSEVGPVESGAQARRDLPAGGVFVDNASGGPDPNNGQNELLIELYGTLLGADHPLQPGRWTVELWAPSLGTRYDGWSLDVPFSSRNADASSTVSLPATAPGLIAVGAYVSRTDWTSWLGTREHFEAENPVGQIAVFSSLGPTRDGRVKPDLTAPGSLIASALAQGAADEVGLENVLPDGLHYVNRGTSFAAPHVSGAVALWFQLAPRLSQAEVLQRLQQDARRDEFTGFATNDTWGSGKLRLSLTPQPPPSPTLAQALDENGNGRLDDREILGAVRLWVSGEVVASAADGPIGDAAILRLIELWILQRPVG